MKELNQQIAQLQPQAARSTAIDRRIAQAKARIDLLDRFRARTKDDIDIVNELTRLLPPPVWIASLEIHPDNVSITGEADSGRAAAESARLLAAVSQFRIRDGRLAQRRQRKLPHQNPWRRTSMPSAIYLQLLAHTLRPPSHSMRPILLPWRTLWMRLPPSGGRQ